MGTNTISIKIANSVEEAPDYKTNGEGFKAATLDAAIVVRKGTVGGNDTVDLQFHDEAGNKYVAMVTGNILKTLASTVNIGE